MILRNSWRVYKLHFLIIPLHNLTTKATMNVNVTLEGHPGDRLKISHISGGSPTSLSARGLLD